MYIYPQYVYSPLSMMVIVAVSPFSENIPNVLKEEPNMRMVSFGSVMLSSVIMNVVFLVVAGPLLAKNVTIVETGPLKSALTPRSCERDESAFQCMHH